MYRAGGAPGASVSAAGGLLPGRSGDLIRPENRPAIELAALRCFLHPRLEPAWDKVALRRIAGINVDGGTIGIDLPDVHRIGYDALVGIGHLPSLRIRVDIGMYLFWRRTGDAVTYGECRIQFDNRLPTQASYGFPAFLYPECLHSQS